MVDLFLGGSGCHSSLQTEVFISYCEMIFQIHYITRGDTCKGGELTHPRRACHVGSCAHSTARRRRTGWADMAPDGGGMQTSIHGAIVGSAGLRGRGVLRL